LLQDDSVDDSDKTVTQASGTREDPIVIEKRSDAGSEETRLTKRMNKRGKKADPIGNIISGAERAPVSNMLYDGPGQSKKYTEMQDNAAKREKALAKQAKKKKSKTGKVLKYGAMIAGGGAVATWAYKKFSGPKPPKARVAPAPEPAAAAAAAPAPSPGTAIAPARRGLALSETDEVHLRR
jgi:hypothetical protein